MTGSDLAAELKKRQPSLKVVFTSGYSSELVGKDFGQNHTAFLSKPYQPEQVARIVRNALERRAAPSPPDSAPAIPPRRADVGGLKDGLPSIPVQPERRSGNGMGCGDAGGCRAPQSGAEAHAVQTLARVAGRLRQRGAFGLRAIYRRCSGAGATSAAANFGIRVQIRSASSSAG